ncbi:MAG TPA: adenylate/guanylate cyclase domain-containing protein [Gaiellaceae bacterium]|nr:adenylate/guanylate cyclase domain-containing protein [Gaiellaceae bacterium]
MVVRVRKTVSVLFADVVGSTSLGERVDPEAMRNALERYFDAMRAIVEGHGGTVEKFVGDAVLAVFGIPNVHEDDALRAVRAAVAMREELRRLRPELGVELRARIGINTGEVVTGEGDTFATGDTMNVAARLEQYAEPDEILIGATTVALVSDAVRVEPLDPLSLKGKSEPVAAFRLVEVRPGPPHERPLVGPFVGRRPELARLIDELSTTVDEAACRMLAVTGEAGIGKSRLVREFALRTEGDARLLIGRCLSYGEGITYWPLRDVVHRLAGTEPLPELTRLLGDPTVAETVAGAIGAATSAATSGEIQWSVRRLLEALATERPLVLVLDDLHWAEPAFLDLVDYLHGFIRAAPVLLIATGRPELIDARPAWRSFALELSPLSEAEAAELVDGLRNGFANDLSARVVESAEGNPLFVEQFCAMVAESGELLVSPSIQGLLAARIDQLPTEERGVAERGAIEGRLFHRGAVSELSPIAERADLAARLSSLVRRDLVRPAQSLFVGDDGYRFAHALVREAVYAATPKALRAELHEQFASWAERTSDRGLGTLDEILGYHLERACRYREELGLVDSQTTALGARAAERLAAAGRRAYQRGDIAAAAGLLTRAASLWQVDELPRLAVLPELGAALNMSGELVRADDVLTEAIERAADVAPAIQARALIERAIVRGQMGDSGEWAAGFNRIATSAIPVLEEAGDHVGLAKAWKMLGLRHVHAEFRYERARPKLERALDHARLARDGQEQGELQIWLGAVIVYGPTPVEEGILHARTALARASSRTEIATLTTVLSLLEAMRGRFDRARDLAAQAKEIYGELGLGLWAAAMGNVWGPIELLAGEPAAAEQELRHSYDELERIGEQGYLSSVAGWLSRALYEQRRDEEADRFAEICAARAGPDDRISQIQWRAMRAKVLARRGELAEAEGLARDAVELVESTDALEYHADALVGLAEVLQPAGRADEAATVLLQALELYERKGVIPSIARTRRLLETAGVPGRFSGGDTSDRAPPPRAS